MRWSERMCPGSRTRGWLCRSEADTPSEAGVPVQGRVTEGGTHESPRALKDGTLGGSECTGSTPALQLLVFTYSAENTSLSILFHKDFVCLEKITKTVNAVKTQGPLCRGENTANRWPSASQKDGPRQEPDPPAAAAWTSLPQGRNEYR